MDKNKLKQKKVINQYLERRTYFDSPQIFDSPDSDLAMIIVIPAFNETLESVQEVLFSLVDQSANYIFEVIIVINHGINDDEKIKFQNQKLFDCLEQLKSALDFPLLLLRAFDLPRKKAGVGLARKIGMDEALRRWHSMDKNGLIICLDADSPVKHNYIEKIIDWFEKYQKLDAVSIGFEHKHPSDQNQKLAIIKYELHLRYFIQIQAFVGLPFAIQTVGSAMGVRAYAYAQEGGMPVSKAGEDFYFLHKFIAKNKCGSIEEPLVFPSSRESDRVPFGTGRAIGTMLSSNQIFSSYDPKSFIPLLNLSDLLDKYYHQNVNLFPNLLDSYNWNNHAINYFINEFMIQEKLNECRENASSFELFKKRFYQKFDAFILMKYVHYMRDNIYFDKPIITVVNEFELLRESGLTFKNEASALEHYRMLDAQIQ